MKAQTLTRITLFCVIIAALISIFNLVININWHYSEEQPHTQDTETLDRLNRLDANIGFTENMIENMDENKKSDAGVIIQDVKILRQQANQAWNIRDYSKAEYYIAKANDELFTIYPIPSATGSISWWFIGVVIVIVTMFAGVIAFIGTRDKQTKQHE
jgi:hypothetical protein